MMNKDWISKYALVWMFFSLLLLSVVLVFWNIDNYNNEKNELASEIDYNAQLAIGEMRDSVYQIVINNINRDKDGIESNINITLDRNNSDSIFHTDSLLVTIFGQSEVEFFTTHEKQSILKVIEGTNAKNGFVKRDDAIEMKSITVLQNKLKDRGLPDFQLGDHMGVGVDGQIEKPNISKEQRIYLLKKILPSILVSLLLFFVICGTYFVIYRSWKNQQKINQFKNEFVSNMTHELKTPLSTVGVALEALGDFGAANDPKKTKEYIDISKHEVNRLNILVDKVLKMSMYEKGMLKINQEPVDLQNVVTSTLAAMKLHFEKNKALVNYTDSGSHFQLTGDAVHITNVIYNLIDNGIKYSRAQPILDINLIEKNDSVELSFRDSGIGIEKGDIDKIFSQFYRVSSNDIHDVKGYGLGLNYVQSIVEEHKGTIHVDSSLGHGSTFTLTFPKNKV